MKKVQLTFLFTVLMSMVGARAMAHDFAVKNADGKTIYYIKTSSTAVAVTYRGDNSVSYSNEYTGNVVIPESVTYNGSTYSVTSIDRYAFHECTGLTSVTIPNSVTSIGDDAFRGCSGLQKVIALDIAAWCGISFGNVTANPLYYAHHIYSDENTEITDLVIPDGVNGIVGSAFFYCTDLISVTIPNSVTSIGIWAFYGCTGLTSVTIPNSVTSIEFYAFSGCTGLASVTINSNSIISAYRSYDSSLKNIFGEQVTKYIIGDVVTSIGHYAFCDCTSLTSVSIPNSVASIDYGAFYGCTGLTSITIPNSVTSIGGSAFDGCSGLTSITIPNSVTSIGNYAFQGCSGLQKVIVSDIAAWCGISFGNEFGNGSANPLYSAHHLYSDENTEITNLTIPNSVTNIGRYAFYGCRGLTSITIGNSVTSIGSDAFYGCSGLQKVIVPDIDIAAWCGISFGNGSANPLCYAHHLYRDENTEITNLVIPEGVTSIRWLAFKNCIGLTSITIPNSVTSIGDHAFYGCTGLTSVTIPNSVTSIGGYAFSGCTGLASVTINSNSIISEDRSYNSSLKNIFGEQVTQYIIGNEVTSIGQYAFYGCSGLTSITIPNSVTWIGGDAFFGCSSLTLIAIPDGVAMIKDGTFSGCTGLTSVTIPSGVTSIGSSAFYGCSSLTSIVIPNSVTSIGNDAFNACEDILTIIIGDGINTIGTKAFANCISLTDVYCYANKVNQTSQDAFSGSGVEWATLHVPESSIKIYKTVSPWSGFGNFVPLNDSDPKPTGIINVNREATTNNRYYTLDGREVETPRRGVYIVKQSDGTVKRVVVK